MFCRSAGAAEPQLPSKWPKSGRKTKGMGRENSERELGEPTFGLPASWGGGKRDGRARGNGWEKPRFGR